MCGAFLLRKTVEVNVDYRREVERKELREQQSADDGKAQWLADFGAGAKPEGNW